MKRTRYEAIIKKFEEMGFLQTYVDKMPNSEGQIRYFYVNFPETSRGRGVGQVGSGKIDVIRGDACLYGISCR